MDLKNRLRDIETDCRDRLHVELLRIVEASTAPTSMALTCRWRSRPQHQKRTLTRLFDHFVGTGEYCRWHCEAEHLGGFEIDHTFNFGGKLDRQIAGRGAF